VAFTASLTGASDPSAADTAAGFHYSFAASAAGLAADYASAGTASSASLSFATAGLHTVYGRVFDKDNGKADFSPTITISNQPPTITGTGGPYTIAEGQSLTLTGSATDPENDPLTYSWKLNGHANAASGSNPTLTWAQLQALGIDDGPDSFSIQLSVSDPTNPAVTAGTTLTLNNTPPTATFNVPASAEQGMAFTVSLTGATDPAAADTAAGFHYSFATSPGGLATDYASAGTAASASLSFATAGPHSVYGRVFDKDNGQTDFSQGLTIINQPPTITGAGGPYTIAEGQTLILSGSATDPERDPLTFAWMVNGHANAATGTGPTLTWAQLQALGIDDGPGSFAIQLSVSDPTNPAVTANTTLTLNNTSPTGTLNLPAVADQAEAFTVSLTGASDSSAADTAAGFRYSFATSPGGLAANYAGAGTASSANLSFATTGSHTVYARLFDKDNGQTDYSQASTITRLTVQGNYTVQSELVADSGSQVVATFTDPAGARPATAYTATIDWGDGTPTSPDVTPGTISGPDAGTFTVKGSHTYHVAGPHTVQVTVALASASAATVSATSTAEVGGDIVVVGTDGDDTLVIIATNTKSGSFVLNGSPAVAFVGATSFTFLGRGGNDTFVIHNPVDTRFAPAVGIHFDGGGQAGDNLALDGGGSGFREDFETGTAPGIGALYAGDGTVQQVILLTGVAAVLDTTAADSLTAHDATDAADAISVSDGGAAGRLRVSFGGDTIELANKTELVINSGLSAADQGKTITLANTTAAAGLSLLVVNGGAGNDAVFAQATAAGLSTILNTGGGDDTVTVASADGTLDALAAPLDIDAGAGSNELVINESGRTAPDTVVLTDSWIGGEVVPFLVSYTATGGSFGRGVLFSTGSGDNLVSVWSTAAGAPLTVRGGAGADSFYVGAADEGLPDAFAGPLTIDGGGGANLLAVSTIHSTTAVAFTLTGSTLTGTSLPFALSYTATGGDFSRGVLLTTGEGDDSVLVLGTAAAAPASVFTDGGTDRVEVRTTPATTSNLEVSGGGAVGDLLAVTDGAGGTTIQKVLAKADAGMIAVLYDGGAVSHVNFDGFPQVVTSPTAK
jgi:hypothetical protein